MEVKQNYIVETKYKVRESKSKTTELLRIYNSSATLYFVPFIPQGRYFVFLDFYPNIHAARIFSY